MCAACCKRSSATEAILASFAVPTEARQMSAEFDFQNTAMCVFGRMLAIVIAGFSCSHR